MAKNLARTQSLANRIRSATCKIDLQPRHHMLMFWRGFVLMEEDDVMKEVLINIVIGDQLEPNLSNHTENFFSSVVPQVGSGIVTRSVGPYRVNKVIYDYRQIGHKDKSKDGGEMVWVFV